MQIMVDQNGWCYHDQRETQVGNLRWMSVTIPLRQPTGHHVAVIDCLHLVHVVALNPEQKIIVYVCFLKRDFCAI